MDVLGRSLPAARVQRAGVAIALIAAWPPRRWLVAVAVALLAALMMGMPTGVVPTDFYTRMTPVRWWDYPLWATSALLIGLIAATYVRVGDVAATGPDRSRRTLGASLLATFAIGCPICNKLVVTAIGVSGALSYWAPLQPLLGVLGVVLLLTGLTTRLRGQACCPVPAH